MILAILQARVSSTRLPGKVMMNVGERPLLAVMIERMLRSQKINKLIVATSGGQSDDPIAALCADSGVSCYRGSLEDVLARFYGAASMYQPDHIVRVTGDCPLIDPVLIDLLIGFYLNGGFDYASNNRNPTFPDGMDAEVFSFSLLEKAFYEAKLVSEREHVTPFMYREGNGVKVGSYENGVDLSGVRLTVDEKEDLAVIRAIFDGLYSRKPDFGLDDILGLLRQRPELLQYNSMYVRNEGYAKSLLKDKEFLEKTP